MELNVYYASLCDFVTFAFQNRGMGSLAKLLGKKLKNNNTMFEPSCRDALFQAFLNRLPYLHLQTDIRYQTLKTSVGRAWFPIATDSPRCSHRRH